MEKDLADFCLVSKATLVEGTEGAPADAVASEDGAVKVKVAVCELEKCERCWKRSDDVGQNPEHEHVCGRCYHVLHD